MFYTCLWRFYVVKGNVSPDRCSGEGFVVILDAQSSPDEITRKPSAGRPTKRDAVIKEKDCHCRPQRNRILQTESHTAVVTTKTVYYYSCFPAVSCKNNIIKGGRAGIFERALPLIKLNAVARKNPVDQL